MHMTAEQGDWFHRMHTEWFQVMQPFVSGFQIGPVFPPLPRLRPERLRDCLLLPSRQDMLVHLPTRGVCAEIGTQEGRFAESIWTITKPQELHLFDLYDEPLRVRSSGLLEQPGVQLHLGDSSANLATFPDDYFDWIYVDGDHSYDGVMRDIAVAQTRVKPGGLLIFNDFTIWSPAECCDYGVPYAVCEFVEQYDWDFVYFALHPHLYNDVALRRPWHRGRQ